MRIFTCIYFCFFCTLVICQNSYLELKADIFELDKKETFTKSISKNYYQVNGKSFTSPFRMKNKGKIIFWTGVSLAAVGSFLWFHKSKKTYREYTNIKNDILYNSNNFTQDDLLDIDSKRKARLQKANNQKATGQILSGLGLSISVVFPLIAKTEDNSGM